MDIFTEHMVKRKKQPIDTVKVILCVLGILVVILFMPIVARNQYIGTIAFLLCAGLIYLIYNVMLTINLEYEYTFTNGAMDIDKIIAAKRRKRMISLNAREIEMMAPVTNRAFDGYMRDGSIKKINACSSIKDDGVFFVLFSRESKRHMLIFNPNETIFDGFRRLNPQKVFKD